eukprot:9501276-Pyramimonas_sp.AAC.1
MSVTGVGPQGKSSGIREGDGLRAFQETHDLYSAFSRSTLPSKISLTAGPGRPGNICDLATQ